MKKIDFPVFRKYHNGHSYFKVINANQFEELKKMPHGYFFYTFEVKILPDRNFIQDMLHNYHDYWEEIPESEYEAIKKLTTG